MNKHELFDQIEQLTKSLAVANADVALLSRLKQAEVDAVTIANELEDAQAKLVSVLNAEQVAKRKGLYANIKSVAVTDKSPQENVLGTSFTVSVCRERFNHNTGATYVEQQDYAGFQTVPAEVIAYITDQSPHSLPDKIMRLAPGKPVEAFDRFMISKNRGYVMGAVA